LIIKLEAAMNDRIDALLSVTPEVNTVHLALGSIPNPQNTGLAIPHSYERRAQVIALIDMLRAEMPDVFFVQNDANYPINSGPPTNLFLPALPGLFAQPQSLLYTTNTNCFTYPIGATYPIGSAGFNGPARGVYGASFAAAAGIYKNLGYHPLGYD